MISPARRVRWTPRVSIAGIVSGVLMALGTLGVLQQSGRAYPTQNVFIGAIIAGVAAGVVLPSIARLAAVRRINGEAAEPVPGGGSVPGTSVDTRVEHLSQVTRDRQP